MKSEVPSERPPAISIVMAAYNEEQSIGRAIESILAQTFINWELIIIDDGSTDTTTEVIERYANNDSRIRLFSNEVNMQLPASLNKGIGLAKADLVARADADDVNLPERLSKQYDYLREHGDVDVVGTAGYLLDEAGCRVGCYTHPLTHAELEELPFIKIQFFHPSVLIRRRFFDRAGLYNPNYPRGQDKELWLRGLKAGCRYANLPEKLIEYSTGGYVMSWKSMLRQLFDFLRLAKEMKVERGYAQAFVLFVYTAAIKLRLYKPKSLRLNEGASSSE